MSYREEWKEVKLKDVASIFTGFPFKSKYYSLEEGTKVVRGENVSLGYLKWGTTKFWNKVFSGFDKYSLEDGDIVIGMDGSRVGKNKAQVRKADLPLLLAQRVALVRSNNENNQDYIAFIIKSIYFERYVNRIKTGTSIPHISKSQIEDFKFTIPKDLDIQNRIASILSAFDEKIELNRAMNATLEAMAQAMFREMCLPEDEENLEDGWEWRKIGDLVDTISNTYKFKGIDEIIFLNTGDVSRGFVQHHNYRPTKGLPGQAKKRIQKGDILYSEIRPKNKRYAYVDFDAEDYVVSTKLMVLRSKEIIDTMYIYFYLTQDDVIAKLQQLAEARSGTFPQITFTQLKNVDIPIPPKAILDDFLNFLKPAYEKIYQNYQENLELSKTRDLLLPKLMSGEIEV